MCPEPEKRTLKEIGLGRLRRSYGRDGAEVLNPRPGGAVGRLYALNVWIGTGTCPVCYWLVLRIWPGRKWVLSKN